MDAKILLGRILQRLIDNGYCQVKGYNRYDYLSHTDNKVIVGREEGKDTLIYFSKIMLAIEKYQDNPNDYSLKPVKLRDYGITHVTSPIWSLLHLLTKNDYTKHYVN